MGFIILYIMMLTWACYQGFHNVVRHLVDSLYSHMASLMMSYFVLMEIL